MMKVLVIPDVHLKPWMFQRASALLKQHVAEKAVCLMDIPDDWNMQYNLEAYEQTFDTAIWFAKEHPSTLWCYGNHDVSYVWQQKETGYSPIAPRIVCTKLQELKIALPDANQLAFIHRIDNVLFMHGGLTDNFVHDYIADEDYGNTDKVLETINQFGYTELWHDDSPLWYRPPYRFLKMYQADTMLQVVGHTPVQKIRQTGNLILCDSFSYNRDRTPHGEQKYLLLDTNTWEWNTIN